MGLCDVLEGGEGADYFDCGDGIDIVMDFEPANGDIISVERKSVKISLVSCGISHSKGQVMRCIPWSYYCIVRFIRNFSLPFLLLGDVLRGHLQHGQIYPS